jgi:hypothetical protein
MSDWHESIADLARPELTEPGAVIVAWSAGSPWLASRLYRAADYATPRKRSAAVWGRVTQMLNADEVGTNYYVVERYSDDSVVVYNGKDSILWEGDDPRLLVTLDEAKEAIRRWRVRAEKAERIVRAEKQNVEKRLQEGIDKAVAAMEACQYVDGPPEHEAWRAVWNALSPLATPPKGMTNAED